MASSLDRERLYELMVDKENELVREYQYFDDSFRIRQVVDHLLANGVIVPPCNVGDKVFVIDTYDRIVVEMKFNPCMLNDIGKIVFLTKEEAEKALE